MVDRIKVDVALDNLEKSQLKELYSNEEAEKIFTMAHDFFDFDFKCLSQCIATITFMLADKDEIKTGATLRKITKPALLNKEAKGRQKDAIMFLEHLLGSAVLSLRNYNCPHSRNCVDFIAEKCNLNSPAARRESRKTCLGFSCTQCRFFQVIAEVKVDMPKDEENFFVKQEPAWDAMIRNFAQKRARKTL